MNSKDEVKGQNRMHSRLKTLVLQRQVKEGRTISQREIARATGITANTINRWFSDDPITRVDESVIVPLCEYLNCEIGDILHIRQTAE